MEVAGGKPMLRGRLAGDLGLSLAAALLLGVAALRPADATALDRSVCLIDSRVAIQIVDCSGLLCGQIVWLQASVDSGDRVIRDKINPDPLLRQRKLCGLTILWGLHATDLDHWRSGWFYNPDNGTTYRVSAELVTQDLLVARIYLGFPLFGRTKVLHRVPLGTSKGWC
jgi:uncharacterized protein (DUF2147 family)